MKISIVMPSYNQASFLPEAIGSVLDQEGDFEAELIVVDGGSEDGSVGVLRSIVDPRMVWSSEPDEGQSHAINKGFAKATGDVYAWLNSDDCYLPGALLAVARGFEASPDKAWLTGPCLIVDRDDHAIRGAVTRYKNSRLRRYSRSSLFRENYISQPATFWRASAWEQVGPVDQALNWTMDYDLWLRLSALGDPIILEQDLAAFRLYQESKTGSFQRAQYDEGYRVACRYLPGWSVDRVCHRLNVEKIVWSYRVAKWFGV